MAGRGLRLKSHTDHCLVLDFAGLVSMHGAITDIKIPKKNGEGEGVPPMKECPKCMEIQHAAKKICVSCGFEFPVEKKEDDLYLRNDDIMGIEPNRLDVQFWRWENVTSKKTGNDMLKVTYYGDIGQKPVIEFFCINHPGYASIRAWKSLNEMGIDTDNIEVLNNSTMPDFIVYKKDGNFNKILQRGVKDGRIKRDIKRTVDCVV
jgi:DNA repair protein RadD